MASSGVCPQLAFSALPGENVFHKARSVRLTYTPTKSHHSQSLQGDIFLSSIRVVFVQKLDAASLAAGAEPVVLSASLEFIEDERVMTPVLESEYIEFSYVPDAASAGPTTLAAARAPSARVAPAAPAPAPAAAAERGGRREVVAAPAGPGGYKLSFQGRPDTRSDTIVKVFYLLLHYLYQLRFGPVYRSVDDGAGLPPSPDGVGPAWGPGPDADPCGACAPARGRAPSRDAGAGRAGSGSGSGSGSPRRGSHSRRVVSTMTFVDPETQELYHVDACVEPSRVAFLDPVTGTLFLAEERLEPIAAPAAAARPAAPTPPLRPLPAPEGALPPIGSGSAIAAHAAQCAVGACGRHKAYCASDLRRTFAQVKNLCLKHPR